MLTIADQDYLKAICRLQDGHRSVTTSALATALGVTAASVSGMLKKLSQNKMVVHRSHQGVRLTARGRRAALQVIRRHRLVELFLVEVLGLPWEAVHKEAERLEHAVSDEVLDRIDNLLGRPRFDPHGSPIPTSAGDIPVSRAVGLNELVPGQSGTVAQVEDEDPALLQYLASVGLVPGADVSVRDVLEFDRSLTVQIGKRRHTVSAKTASAVRIDVEK